MTQPGVEKLKREVIALRLQVRKLKRCKCHRRKAATR